MAEANDENRTDDNAEPEKRPAMGAETGRQSTYFGSQAIPGSLNGLGLRGLGGGLGALSSGWIAGQPALLTTPVAANSATPEAIAGSVVGIASMLPGYASTAPGTYLTYRQMRGNPTIAIARAAATAPIRAAEISVEGPDATDEQVEFIESVIMPLWPRFVRDAMFALDYGWQPFERVYGSEDGYIVLKKLKPLAVDLSIVRVDEATGAFAGVDNGNAKLDASKAFAWTYDQEYDGYYGRSRHENIRDVWWAWIELLRKEGQYVSKIAGVLPVITYPDGVGRDKNGRQVSNEDLATQVLSNLGRGSGVAMPNRLAEWAGDLMRGGVDVTQLAAWQIKFLESQGQHGSDMVGQMQHKEALMLRGWLVPERSVIEGRFGTKAEASEHTAMSVSIAQHDLFDLLRCVNEYIVDPLLALNFGPQARGTVSVTASPLIDDKALLARRVVEAVLTNPANLDMIATVVDLDTMIEQQGIPTTDVSLADAKGMLQPEPGPAADPKMAGNGRKGPEDPTADDEEDPEPQDDDGQQQMSLSRVDARIKHLSSVLLRERQVGAWRAKRGKSDPRR